MLKLPNDKVVYNLPEQVGVNTENIKYLAEVYKDIDQIPTLYAAMVEDYNTNVKGYFDDTMKPTFTTWTNTFDGWTNTLDTYLASMSSAALGAIANGTVVGNFAVNGDFTADSIIENMSGYRIETQITEKGVIEYVYCGVVKNGNKLTIVNSVMFTKNESATGGISLARIGIPAEVMNKIIPAYGAATGNIYSQSILAIGPSSSITPVPLISNFVKYDNQSVYCSLREISSLVAGTRYYIRQEATFLLSENLAA